MEYSTVVIEEFYNQSRFKENLTLYEFKLICTAPFKMLRHVMQTGILVNVRFEYFCVFEVSGSRVKYSRGNLEKNYKDGLISEKRYNERIKVLDNYEKRNE